MNILMLRNQPASRRAPISRVGCAAWVWSFEFKILRLHRVLSIQISVIYVEPSYWLNVVKLGRFVRGFGISSKVMRLKFEPREKGACAPSSFVPEQLVSIRHWTLILILSENLISPDHYRRCFFSQNLEASIPFYFQICNTPKTCGRPPDRLQKHCAFCAHAQNKIRLFKNNYFHK